MQNSWKYGIPPYHGPSTKNFPSPNHYNLSNFNAVLSMLPDFGYTLNATKPTRLDQPAFKPFQQCLLHNTPFACEPNEWTFSFLGYHLATRAAC